MARARRALRQGRAYGQAGIPEIAGDGRDCFRLRRLCSPQSLRGGGHLRGRAIRPGAPYALYRLSRAARAGLFSRAQRQPRLRRGKEPATTSRRRGIVGVCGRRTGDPPRACDHPPGLCRCGEALRHGRRLRAPQDAHRPAARRSGAAELPAARRRRYLAGVGYRILDPWARHGRRLQPSRRRRDDGPLGIHLRGLRSAAQHRRVRW